MRISIVHDWVPNLEQELTWHDGLAAAIRILSERHVVDFITIGERDMILSHDYFPIHVVKQDKVAETVEKFKPDVILTWADMTRPSAQSLRELGIPMAICFAGGEPINYNTPYFDHIFVESEVYLKVFKDAGYSASIAFGTNTELFKPIKQPKLFDTIFPGTFALWKRHQLYAQSVEGLRSIACGFIYEDHETECWEDCLKYGTMILPHVSAEALQRLYAASKVCIVPSMSSGGSQRTVLEAMSMNIPLVITDSDKFDYAWATDEVFQVAPSKEDIRSIVDHIIHNRLTVNTRDYVKENWSEYTYADAIEKGLLELCA